MKINKINVIYKRSIQMRQFEPADISINVEAQVDPGDKVDEVIRSARKTAKEHVEAEYERLKKLRYETMQDEMEKAA